MDICNTCNNTLAYCICSNTGHRTESSISKELIQFAQNILCAELANNQKSFDEYIVYLGKDYWKNNKYLTPGKFRITVSRVQK